MRKPCIDCGSPADGTRCPQHAAAHTARKDARQSAARALAGPRIYDRGTYRQAAAIVRATATVCHICGERARPNDPWQADHLTPVHDGGDYGPLAAAHRSCNVARGNRTRHDRTPPPDDTRRRTNKGGTDA